MNNKKYISVEDAIKTTWMILDGLGYAFDENPQLKKTVPAVFDTAPTADVRPVVRGRWELLQVADEAGDKWNRWFCSACCHVAAVGWEHTRDGAKPKYNFCPNCGARMEDS